MNKVVNKNQNLEELIIQDTLDITIDIEESAFYHAFIIAKDSVNITINHLGKDSESSITIIALAKDTDDIMINSKINHKNSHQTSSQLIRTLADDNAVIKIKGEINIESGLEKIQADLENKHLQLSSEAKIFTQPILTINSDDVKSSHGATIGKLNEDQLFYLQSRGLSKKESKQILEQAFIQELINLENQDMQEKIIQELHYAK